MPSEGEQSSPTAAQDGDNKWLGGAHYRCGFLTPQIELNNSVSAANTIECSLPMSDLI
jgi:hypothetical protein